MMTTKEELEAAIRKEMDTLNKRIEKLQKAWKDLNRLLNLAEHL